MSKMRRKQLIIKLMHREIKRLHKENKQLHDKHWSECRRIALYDDEVRIIKNSATIRNFSRMCKANNDCEFCPMTKAKLAVDCECSTCAEMIADHPDEANAAILKWCAEHPETPESVSEQPEEPEKPKKTYKEDFLEKFPNAPVSWTGFPHGCVCHVYGNFGDCRSNCSDCWNEVMKDE